MWVGWVGRNFGGCGEGGEGVSQKSRESPAFSFGWFATKAAIQTGRSLIRAFARFLRDPHPPPPHQIVDPAQIPSKNAKFPRFSQYLAFGLAPGFLHHPTPHDADFMDFDPPPPPQARAYLPTHCVEGTEAPVNRAQNIRLSSPTAAFAGLSKPTHPDAARGVPGIFADTTSNVTSFFETPISPYKRYFGAPNILEFSILSCETTTHSDVVSPHMDPLSRKTTLTPFENEQSQGRPPLVCVCVRVSGWWLHPKT